jgi:hypothetical protein
LRAERGSECGLQWLADGSRWTIKRPTTESERGGGRGGRERERDGRSWLGCSIAVGRFSERFCRGRFSKKKWKKKPKGFAVVVRV